MNDISENQATELTDGGPVTSEHRDLRENGQQKGYVVLTKEERGKGFVRPLRRVYVHASCKAETRISLAIAETYARDPKFYDGTFCCGCKKHFSLDQFYWEGSDEIVGS